MKIKLGLLMGILTFLFSEFAFAEESVVYKSFEVTISYDGNAAANVPTLLRLSEDNILGFSYSDVVNKSFKIFDKDKNILSYEIDTWNEEGESTLWVKVPDFSDGQILEVRYGLDYSSDLNSKNVWSEYVGVWHLGEINNASTYGSYPNSTAVAGIDAEKAEASIAGESGFIGKSVLITDGAPKSSAQNLGGVFIPDSGENSPLDLEGTFAISGWFLHKNTNMYYDHIFYKRLRSDNTQSPNNAFAIEMNANNTKNSKLDIRGSSSYVMTLPQGLFSWTYLTFIYDSTKVYVYQNGAYVSEGKITNCIDNDAPIAIGNNVAAYGNGVGDAGWMGWVDEVRLMDGKPSADYLAAEYAAMGNADLLSYGNVSVGAMGFAEISSNPILKWNGTDFEFSCEIYPGKGRMFAIYENTVTGAAFTNELEFSSVGSATPVVVNDYPVFEDEGNYTCSILSVIEEYSMSFLVSGYDYVYAGTPIIQKMADVDEYNFTPGVLRFSRSEAAVDKELSFSVALSGPAIDAGVVENNLTTVTIPVGLSYVDVEIMPIWVFDITDDLSFELTISGSNFAATGDLSEEIKVISAKSNMLVRYVSTTGSDENDGLTMETPFLTIATAVKTLDKFGSTGEILKVYVDEGLYPSVYNVVLTNAIQIFGMYDDPSRVVISNMYTGSNQDKERRLFKLNHKDAVVANLTMQNGSVCGSYTYGGSFIINANGGMVSNCIVEASTTSQSNAYPGGGHLENGIVTHTIFRQCRTRAGSASWEKNRSGVLQAQGTSRVENCLFVDNPQTTSVVLINVQGNAIMRNCSIIDASLASTNADCSVFSALRIGANTTVQNVVVVGVTNTVDGACVLPTGTVANFANGALDGDITDKGFPEETIVGTKADFFTNYADGNYRPNPFGKLVGAGANYDGMALYDLSGEYARLVGGKIDIGCYEGFPIGTVIFVK